MSTIEQDAARIAETYRFYRYPGTLTVSHDNGLACLDIVSDVEIEGLTHVWLTIASHRDGNAAMRITVNGQLHRICQHCNMLKRFNSLDPEEQCEDCLKPRSYYKPDPIKQRARGITNRAIKNGLVRGEPEACEDCGRTDESLTVHHKDYSDPLDIEWLCTKCHGKRHRGWRKYYSFRSPAEARMAWSD